MTNQIWNHYQWIPSYLYAPILAAVWMLALWLIKRLIVRRLRRWAKTTTQTWDDILIESLSFPFNFLIFASGLTILTNLLSLPDNLDKLSGMAFQGSIIFAIVFFLDRVTAGVLQENSSKAVFGQISHGVVKGLTRGFIIGLGILTLLNLIGISITPILASLGIGSLAVALALQDTLSNFFAGIYVAVDKPVQIGQYVKLESGDEGYVIDVGWRSTRIRTLPNNVVIVPNSKLIGSIITNYYLPDKEMAVLLQVGVHYASDLKKVEKVTSETAKEVLSRVQGGVPGFEPFIRYHTFGDSSINFTVILRGKEYVDQHLIKHEFIKALHERYKKENITIPFPIRTLELSKELENSLLNASPKQ